MLSDQSLMQLRWNHIRSIESQLATDEENTNLKKTILELKSLLSSSKHKSNISNSYLKQVIDTSNDNISSLKNELKKLKTSYAIDQQITGKMFPLLKESIKKLCETNSLLNKEYSYIHQKYDISSSTIEKLQQEKLSLKEESDLKISKYNIEAQKLSEKLVDALENKLKDGEEIEKLRLSLREIETSKYDKEKKLKSYIKKIEMDHKFHYESLVNNASENEKQIIEHYEKITNEFQEDNSCLVRTIADLNAQIEKLKEQLPNNQSAFSKFVEMKTENALLQSKVAGLQQKERDRNIGRDLLNPAVFKPKHKLGFKLKNDLNGSHNTSPRGHNEFRNKTSPRGFENNAQVEKLIMENVIKPSGIQGSINNTPIGTARDAIDRAIDAISDEKWKEMDKEELKDKNIIENYDIEKNSYFINNNKVSTIVDSLDESISMSSVNRTNLYAKKEININEKIIKKLSLDESSIIFEPNRSISEMKSEDIYDLLTPMYSPSSKFITPENSTESFVKTNKENNNNFNKNNFIVTEGQKEILSASSRGRLLSKNNNIQSNKPITNQQTTVSLPHPPKSSKNIICNNKNESVIKIPCIKGKVKV
jgi:hypothetical protein